MGARLIVDGVPQHFSDQQLIELFEPFGQVVCVHISRDAGGRSLGYGVVEMASFLEAERAQKALSRTKIDNSLLLIFLSELS